MAGELPARAQALLDRGLEKYARGDLLGAINEWQHALSVDRTLTLASEYIDYVRENFDALSDQFAQAQNAEVAAEESGVPLSYAAEDPDAYDSIELSDGERTPLPPEPRHTMRGGQPPVGPKRTPEPAPLPPPPAEDAGMPGLSVGDLDLSGLVEPMVSSADDLGALPQETLELESDPHHTQETTMSRGRHTRQEPETYGGPTSVLTIRPKQTRPPSNADDLPAPPIMAAPPILDLDLGPPIDDGYATIEMQTPSEPFSLGDDESHDSEHTRPRARNTGQGFHDEPSTRDRHRHEIPLEPAADPAFQDDLVEHTPAVIVDHEQLIRQQQRSAGPTAPLQMPPPPPPEEAGDHDDPSHGLAPEASAGDRIRRKVNEHLNQAMLAAEAGDFARAVAEAESAGTADPDGLIAPIILARHREFLHRVYEGHLGDTSRVPLVAVPLHEISAQQLDHRTGFLLSRIDGMLTFEDILDIAGMPRIEAYKILSQLLRKGFIEVR
jgi:hypothetical protein